MIAMYLPAFIIIVAISSVLALLLYLVDRYIADYGSCRLEIRNAADKSCEVAGGKSLLEALNDMQIYLPSSCGGQGTCGYCQLTVHSGGGPVLPTEKLFLSRTQIARQQRLACQVKIRSDISLSVPDDVLAVQEYTVQVTDLDDIAHDLKQIRLQLIKPDRIEFRAGQYIQLRIPDSDELRSYSITSSPACQSAIELLVKLVPGGICSTYIHTDVQVGDALSIIGPYGDFCADRYIGREPLPDLVFIAGGCGIAPIRAILTDLWDKHAANRIYYFFGAQTPAELYFYDEYQERSRHDPNFDFIPAVSSLESIGEWQGHTGHIHTIIKQHSFLPGKTIFFVCGPDVMVEAVKNVLIDQGHGPDMIHSDIF